MGVTDETTFTCHKTYGCILTWAHDPDVCYTELDVDEGRPKPPPPTAPAKVRRRWQAYHDAVERATEAAKRAERKGYEFLVCRECGTSRWERGGKFCDCIPF